MILTPKQTEAMEALQSEKYNFILYGGAIRGGKSVWGLSALLILCQVFPRSRWCVIREDMEKIRTTTIPSFWKLEPSGTLKQSPYEYTHPNGSVILFKSENYSQDKDLDWMKGLEANGFLFEEINECQKQAFYKAFERAGSWIIPHSENQPKPIILATCNPTSGWVKETVYDKYKDNTLPKEWLYIPAKITDNPFLPQAYIDNLQNLPRYEYMVFVEGNWDIQLKTGGEFWKDFDIDKHVGLHQWNESLPIHLSWDENVNPHITCLVYQIEGKNIYQIDEICLPDPRNRVLDACKEFMQRYPTDRVKGLFVYGDRTSIREDTKMEKGENFFTKIIQHLAAYRPSLRMQSSNPSVVQSGGFINEIYRINYENINIFIAENCKKSIFDYQNALEDSDGTIKKSKKTNPVTKVSYEEFGHCSDAHRYFITVAFANEYQSYLKGGIKTSIKTGITRSRSGY